MADVDYNYEIGGLYRYKLVRTGFGDHMQGQMVRDKKAEEDAKLGQTLRTWFAAIVDGLGHIFDAWQEPVTVGGSVLSDQAAVNAWDAQFRQDLWLAFREANIDGAQATRVGNAISRCTARFPERFVANNKLLTFSQWIELVKEDPRQLLVSQVGPKARVLLSRLVV